MRYGEEGSSATAPMDEAQHTFGAVTGKPFGIPRRLKLTLFTALVIDPESL